MDLYRNKPIGIATVKEILRTFRASLPPPEIASPSPLSTSASSSPPPPPSSTTLPPAQNTSPQSSDLNDPAVKTKDLLSKVANEFESKRFEASALRVEANLLKEEKEKAKAKEKEKENGKEMGMWSTITVALVALLLGWVLRSFF